MKNFISMLVMLAACIQIRAADTPLASLQAGWEKPACTYRPHTRWWWPGNALTKADITFQLEQMAKQGMGGVEIMSAFTMYEKGNHEFLSPEHLDLMKFAVAEAKRLDLHRRTCRGAEGGRTGGPGVVHLAGSSHAHLDQRGTFVFAAGGDRSGDARAGRGDRDGVA